MREDTFTTQDGTTLFERRWDVAGARGNVVIVHGFGHHCGSFAAVAERLNAAGYSVFGFDQRGHGKSPGRRGAITRFATTLADLESYMAHVSPVLGGKPLFVLGHSLGALVLGLYVIEKRPTWAGLIFSSGLFTDPDTVSPFLRRVAGVLSAVAPWLPVQRLDSNAVSRDAATLEAVKADPLQYTGLLHARTGAEIANAVARFEARQAEIALPMLVLHGTADRLTECEASKYFCEQAKSSDKSLRLYEGGYHELYNDLVKGQFLVDIITWLDARVK